ncbi:MFS transporter [Nocardia callitridis]|uniref:MFS transporter n=1 Tax=Nocardia callitridis TaxID=648753 RepID=A0ABP9L2C8_9NOCA
MALDHSGTEPRDLRDARLRLIGLIAVTAAIALNIRPGVTTVGPELAAITAHFGAGARAGGVITAAPVICFALVSLATPRILARFSVRTGLFVALAITGVSLLLRPWSGLPVFVLTTCTAAIGVGLITVLLPAFIRASGSTGPLVTTFTTALQAGAALGFASVVPLADAVGGWQWALALWAVLTPIGIGALWRAPAPETTTPATSDSASTNPITILRDTSAVGLAIFFGLQALVAFVVIGWLPSVLHDAGVGTSAAGGYLGLLTCVGVPVSLVVPPLVVRSAHPARWLAGFSLCGVAGILGFLLAPGAAPLVWSLILGVGLSVFSLALTVITVRADSPHAALRLSSAVQGVGYLIAAIGPYAIGLFRQIADSWTLPLTVLLVVALGQAVLAATLDRRTPSTSDEGRPGNADDSRGTRLGSTR